MPQITTCLWFDGKALEAAEVYVSVFPNARITDVQRSLVDTPGDGANTGDVLTVAFELDGKPFLGLNGGPAFQFNEAISLMIDCDDQAEVDYYWDAFLNAGGTPSACGWLKDRFGLSWQVTPKGLLEMIRDPDAAKAKRAFEAMMGMVKLDIAALRTAFEGQ